MPIPRLCSRRGAKESGRGRRHIPAHRLLRRVRDLDGGVIEGLLDAQRRLRHLPHQLLSGSFILEQLDRVESEASDALLDVLAARAGPRSGTSTSRSRSICPRWCGS